MSTQLILYPQNYNGTYSFTSSPVLSQYVADGNFNTGLVSSQTFGSSTPQFTAMINSLPIGAVSYTHLTLPTNREV